VQARVASTSAPQTEYERRLAARRAEAAQWEQREHQLGLGRVLMVASALGCAYLIAGPAQVSPWWLVAPLVGFVVLVLIYQRISAARKRTQAAAQFYRRGLARLQDRWSGVGPDGRNFADPEHPYAGDLDLFGTGSLFQLLCLTKTKMGEETLARWLQEPAPAETARARQLAIRELQTQVDLREDLAMLDPAVLDRLHPEELRAWASVPRRLRGWQAPAVAAVLGTAAAITFFAWQLFDYSSTPFLGVVLVESVLLLFLWKPIREISQGLDRILADLGLLAEVLAVLETRTFTSPRLVELQARLHAAGERPSRQIAGWIALGQNLEQSLRNQVYAPLSFLLLIVVQLLYGLERRRSALGPQIADWLAAAGEFEALAALAGYAFEHPDDIFPEIVEEAPTFAAEGLGHPLLPAARCVRNDVRLGREPQWVLISGSNMSGKSTLLRAVGVNTVLALMGAPVRARSLRLSPLWIGSAMRVQDSLQTGTSHFFAELKRLQAIVALADGSTPVLFLLDEILHGTNSHDRRIGAAAVIRKLASLGALGLVTTHDLALAEIADAAAPQAANVHFEDQLVDGKMVFDYQMRPGIVTKSNALALMRMLGMDV